MALATLAASGQKLKPVLGLEYQPIHYQTVTIGQSASRVELGQLGMYGGLRYEPLKPLQFNAGVYQSTDFWKEEAYIAERRVSVSATYRFDIFELKAEGYIYRSVSSTTIIDRVKLSGRGVKVGIYLNY